MYHSQPYTLVKDPEGRIIAYDLKAIEGGESSTGATSLSRRDKRDSSDLSPRQSPNKRPYFSAESIKNWVRNRGT